MLAPAIRDFAGHAVTAFNGAAISTDRSKFGAASLLPGGGGLELPYSDDWEFGGGDWTVECWIWQNGIGAAPGLLTRRNTAAYAPLHFDILSGVPRLLASTSGANWEVAITASQALATGVWHHLAYERQGAGCTLYIDGGARGAATLSGSLFASANPLYLGTDPGGNGSVNGYISDLRITKGVARYAGDFTPPAAAHPTDSSDPHWGSVVLAMPLDLLDVTPVFTPAATPWVLQAVPAPYAVAPRLLSGRARSLRDQVWGGMGSINSFIGLIDPAGTPERPFGRRVCLLDRKSMLPVRSTYADPATGAYGFTGLRTDTAFMIVADDYAGHYNAVIADWQYAS